MKVLTLTQPWATLVAVGAKTYETRSWSTSFRGPLAIHAAKNMPTGALDACLHTNEIRQALVRMNMFPSDLPRGVILCVCDLITCIRTDILDIITEISDQERAFGNYSAGRFAWDVRNVRRLSEPIPARGALGLWTFDHPALDALATVDDASMA